MAKIERIPQGDYFADGWIIPPEQDQILKNECPNCHEGMFYINSIDMYCCPVCNKYIDGDEK